MSTPAHLLINTDGASKGNPGLAAIGVVIAVPDPDGDAIPVDEIAECIGEATNNVAEYRAVIRALHRALELGARTVDLRTDSELLTKQINGEYRVKNPGLRPLYEEVQRLRGAFRDCTVTHVRREANTHADALANRAIREARARGRASLQ